MNGNLNGTISLILLITLLASFRISHAQELLTNPGFESPTLSESNSWYTGIQGWTPLNGAIGTTYCLTSQETYPCPEGNQVAWVPVDDAAIYQDTVQLVAGETYTFKTKVFKLSTGTNDELQIQLLKSSDGSILDQALFHPPWNPTQEDFNHGPQWTNVTLSFTYAGGQGRPANLRVQFIGDNYAIDDCTLFTGTDPGASARDYYISSSSGSDSNDGLTAATAWATFNNINGTNLGAGSNVYLNRGDTWNQMLLLSGDGTIAEPITLTSYGSGDLPRIVMSDLDHDVCVRIEDASNWQISDLDLRTGRVGLFFHYDDDYNNENILVEDCYFENFPGMDALVAENSYDFSFGSAVWLGGHVPTNPLTGTVLTNFTLRNSSSLDANCFFGTDFYFYESNRQRLRNIYVEDCVAENTHIGAILLHHIDGGHVKRLRLTGRSFGFTDYGSTGALIEDVQNYLIEDCDFAGINRAPGEGDASGFDIDGNNDNIIVRDVVFHDNDGAGLLMLSTNGGSINNVIENCTFYNNGIDGDPRWNDSHHTMLVVPGQGNQGAMTNSVAYRNLVNAGMISWGWYDFTFTDMKDYWWEVDALPYLKKDFGFNTAGDFEDWEGFSNWNNPTVASGALQGSSSSSTPKVTLPQLFANTHITPYARVLMSQTAGNNATIEFVTATDTVYDSAKSVTFPIIADGTMREYVVYLRESPACRGVITGMRFQPTDSSGSTMTIDNFRLDDGNAVQPSVPAAPSNVTVTANTVGELNVNWTDNSSNEDWFIIQRSIDGINFKRVDTGEKNSETHPNLFLDANTTYYYRVAAENISGRSGWSNIASGTTLSESAPAAPIDLLTFVVDNTTVNLAWTDNSTNEVDFEIQRSFDGTVFEKSRSILSFEPATTGTSVAHNDHGLAPGETYWFRIAALNSAGYSTYLGPAQVTMSGLKQAPREPEIPMARMVSSSEIHVTWEDDSSNELGFKVEHSLDGNSFSEISVEAQNTESTTLSGLAAGTTHYFRVAAYNAQGNSSYTAIVNATTAPGAGLPAAPSNLSASTVSDSQIDLSWTDNSSDEDSFIIERSLDGVNFSGHDIVASNVSSYSDVNLNANTTYWYRVKASNLNGDSGSSNVDSATTSGGAATTMHVNAIILSSPGIGQGNKIGEASVTIVDDLGNPVENVTVSGTFSGSFNESQSGVTDANGVATISTSSSQKGSISFSFCVDNATHTVLTYDSNSNIETCDNF